MFDQLKIKARDYIQKNVTFSIERSLRIEELSIQNSISTTPVTSLNSDFVVSLTTFGHRIHDVYLAIESISSQTLKPQKIYLTLDQDEFADEELPISLQRLKERGLHILYCKNTRAYKKLLPVLRTEPDKVIITIDDDVIYGRFLCEELYAMHQKCPKSVVAGETKRILLKKDVPAPYQSWLRNLSGEEGPSHLNIAIGYSGVLYPPECFPDAIFDEEVFMNICPYNDDLWFKSMEILQGTTVVSSIPTAASTSRWIPLDRNQSDSLSKKNIGEGMNDVQFQRLWTKFQLGDKIGN